MTARRLAPWVLGLSLGVLVRGASAEDPPTGGGGLLGGLAPREPDPGPPALPPTPAPGADGEVGPAREPDLDASLATARAALARLRAQAPDHLPALTAERAQEYVRRLEALRESRGRSVTEKDRADAEALREKTLRFEATWGPLEAAVRENRRPPDVQAAQWPAVRDRFFREKSDLAADVLDLRTRLERPARELRSIDDRIAAAKALAERVGRMGAESRELARRIHEARIALAERRLAELEALKAERAGGPPRTNSGVASASPEGDDWYIKTMDWLAGEMARVGRSQPPELGAGGGNLPIPGWGDRDAPLRAAERLRGRVAFIRSQLRKHEEALAGAEAALRASDAAALEERRAQLEVVDRLYDPSLSDAERTAKRAETLDRLRARQGESFGQRLEGERARIDREIETWRTHLETEARNLAEAEKGSAPPGGDGARPPR